MQLLVDYFPLLLFFIAFKWQGIYFATAVAIVFDIVTAAKIIPAHSKSPLIGAFRSLPNV